MDFESGALNVIEATHPNSDLSACFTIRHPTFRIKVEEVGLQPHFNSEFVVHVPMIMALAFVPVADVENAFEDLSDGIRNLLRQHVRSAGLF